MRQSVIPQDKVAGSAGNRPGVSDQTGCVAIAFFLRRGSQPLIDASVKVGNTAERPLIGGGVGEVQQALDPERDRWLKRHVKVQARSRESPLVVLGRVKTATVGRHQQV